SGIPITIHALAFPARRHALSKALSLKTPLWRWSSTLVLSMAFVAGLDIRPHLGFEAEPQPLLVSRCASLASGNAPRGATGIERRCCWLGYHRHSCLSWRRFCIIQMPCSDDSF